MNFFKSVNATATTSATSTSALSNDSSVELIVFPGGRKILSFQEGESLTAALSRNKITLPSSYTVECTVNGVSTSDYGSNPVLSDIKDLERVTVSPMVKGNEGDNNIPFTNDASFGDNEEFRNRIEEHEKRHKMRMTLRDTLEAYAGVKDSEISQAMLFSDHRSGSMMWDIADKIVGARYDLLKDQVLAAGLNDSVANLSLFVTEFSTIVNRFNQKANTIIPTMRRVYTRDLIDALKLARAEQDHKWSDISLQLEEKQSAANNALLSSIANVIADKNNLNDSIVSMVSLLNAETLDQADDREYSNAMNVLYSHPLMNSLYEELRTQLRTILSGIATMYMLTGESIFEHPFAGGSRAAFLVAIEKLQSAQAFYRGITKEAYSAS